MPTYVALLRGVNLGGHKKINMEQLRKSLERMGFEDVQTYIQSGNVIFKTGAVSTAELSRRVEAKILGDFEVFGSGDSENRSRARQDPAEQSLHPAQGNRAYQAPRVFPVPHSA